MLPSLPPGGLRAEALHETRGVRRHEALVPQHRARQVQERRREQRALAERRQPAHDLEKHGERV